MTLERPRNADADGSACPDAERLAEFADGTSSGAERASIERHLANCANCRSAVMEAVRFRDHDGMADMTMSDRAPERGRLLRFRRRWMGAAIAALTAAAVLMVIVRLAPSRQDVAGIKPELAELVAAVSTLSTRPVEGRLTGFPYAPPPSSRRGTSIPDVPPSVRLAAAAIEAKATRNKTAENVAALGVAYLAVGDLDRAIGALDEATRQATTNAAFWSDLSAAYLRRGLRDTRVEDVRAAVGAADRALAANPNLLEAHFNRAMALSSLPTPDRSGLQDYVRRDRGPWADEARQRGSDTPKQPIVFRPISGFTSNKQSLQIQSFIEGGQALTVGTQATDFPANLYADDVQCSAAYVGLNVMMTAGHCFRKEQATTDKYGHLRWTVTAQLKTGPVSGDCERPSGFIDDDATTNRWDVAICSMTGSPKVLFEVVSDKTAPVVLGTEVLLTGFGINLKQGITQAGEGMSVGVAEVTAADAGGLMRTCGPALEFGDSGGGTFVYNDPQFKDRYMVGVNSWKTADKCGTAQSITSELAGLWNAQKFICNWHEEYKKDICGIHLGAQQAPCRNKPFPHTILVQ